jgi:hypothetical protein
MNFHTFCGVISTYPFMRTQISMPRTVSKILAVCTGMYAQREYCVAFGQENINLLTV